MMSLNDIYIYIIFPHLKSSTL